MPKLDPEENFEPSRNIKLLWRFTHKTPKRYTGIVLPGLFDTSFFALYTALFFTVIGLEIWGLVNLLNVGANPVMVVFLFLIDLTLAIVRHLPAGTICELQNHLVWQEDIEERSRLEGQIARRRFLQEFCSFLILIVAIFKVISFYALQGGTFNGLTAGIMVSYLVAAWIHIRVTGSFIFAILMNLFWAIDYNQYLKKAAGQKPEDVLKKITRISYIESSVPLKEASVDRHILTLNNQSPTGGAPGKNQYVLKTVGILTDRQLHAFVYSQPNTEAKIKLMREGVYHQVLNILQAELKV